MAKVTVKTCDEALCGCMLAKPDCDGTALRLDFDGHVEDIFEVEAYYLAQHALHAEVLRRVAVYECSDCLELVMTTDRLKVVRKNKGFTISGQGTHGIRFIIKMN